MQTQAPKRSLMRTFERILVILAAVACLSLTIGIWRSVSSIQSLWPLPGLYFVELPAIAIVTALAFLREDPSSVMTGWITAGVLLAFSVLGAFSIGLFYLPVAIMFIMVAVLGTVRHDSSFLRGLGGFAAAAAVQAFIMFVFINLLYMAQGTGK